MKPVPDGSAISQLTGPLAKLAAAVDAGQRLTAGQAGCRRGPATGCSSASTGPAPAGRPPADCARPSRVPAATGGKPGEKSVRSAGRSGCPKIAALSPVPGGQRGLSCGHCLAAPTNPALVRLSVRLSGCVVCHASDQRRRIFRSTMHSYRNHNEEPSHAGLMQSQQLTISSLIEFADRHHGEGEIVTPG